METKFEVKKINFINDLSKISNSDKDKYIILRKKGNNRFVPALQNKYGVYLIYYDSELIYIGALKGAKSRLNMRVSQHFTKKGTGSDLKNFMYNEKKIGKDNENFYDEFITAFLEHGYIIIGYFEVNEKDKQVKKSIRVQFNHLEQTLINWYDPELNTLRKEKRFPDEWKNKLKTEIE